MRIRKLLAASVIAAVALSAAACGTKSNDSTAPAVDKNVKFAAGTTMEKLNKAQKITVGTKFDQPLFGQKNLKGDLEGFDVEVAKIIAAKLGVPASKIEWVATPSKVREEVIEQGKVDFVVATYTINDKRKQRVGFAGPYYVAGQDIMVNKDDTSITGPDSLRDGVKKVCSVTGSTPAEKIKTFLKDPAKQLVLFDVYSKCADALKNKQVDAVTTDNVILLGLIDASGGKFKLIDQPFTQEPYGIGLKKGDDKFRAFINDTLEAAAKNGDYEKAWKATAGKVKPQAPKLPVLDRY
ncbi:MAG: glutamate transport system substrate-binding protein [Cryptosporangiaceae bacterium]|nr:glutamate transport system substrate-binding protein [Cryptosporangiaceae bacterium]